MEIIALLVSPGTILSVMVIALAATFLGFCWSLYKTGERSLGSLIIYSFLTVFILYLTFCSLVWIYVANTEFISL